MAEHRRATSDLEELTLLQLDHEKEYDHEIVIKEIQPDEDPHIPKASLVIVAETDKLEEEHGVSAIHHERSDSFVASISEFEFEEFSKIKVTDWDGTKFYSDYIKEGLEYKQEDSSRVVILFESPSSWTRDSSFFNRDKYRFHDWPPPSTVKGKVILGPCKYSLMNGSTFPAFLAPGAPPPGLMEHWAQVLPGHDLPRFVDKVTEQDTVYAFLPVEQIKNHVNDPVVHYHLAGKDAIHLMTQKTTKLLPDTRTSRPCVVKTTHSMGSKGIFIIQNDQDEAEFEQFLNDSGNPTFVITDFVDIHRNVACHFFMHPDGEHVTWIGSNENKRTADGKFSLDSYLEMEDQANLKKMQLPFVEEVVQYCKSLGFWGFCGIDVLFDSKGRGYLVDINPRVTGSGPALMTLYILQKKYGFHLGLFRRTGDINFYGSTNDLMEQVRVFNKENEGKTMVVIHSMYEFVEGQHVRLNIGVYGNDMEQNKTVLNRFAQPERDKVV